ncbi:hypothetical protein IWQ60_011171 [Tieghemiomyces parasiticus]|uniref:Alginate lyase domain-containing protein n=1 Tax=Tieghemiomyces parasiticus TaxID=78921 RepID=A0A9W7ZNK0_9FUNG|nr:hypothetical protein IWQ60_011171 [Tieghemiomyces parasiticus]
MKVALTLATLLCVVACSPNDSSSIRQQDTSRIQPVEASETIVSSPFQRLANMRVAAVELFSEILPSTISFHNEFAPFYAAPDSDYAFIYNLGPKEQPKFPHFTHLNHDNAMAAATASAEAGAPSPARLASLKMVLLGKLVEGSLATAIHKSVAVGSAGSTTNHPAATQVAPVPTPRYLALNDLTDSQWLSNFPFLAKSPSLTVAELSATVRGFLNYYLRSAAPPGYIAQAIRSFGQDDPTESEPEWAAWGLRDATSLPSIARAAESSATQTCLYALVWRLNHAGETDKLADLVRDLLFSPASSGGYGIYTFARDMLLFGLVVAADHSDETLVSQLTLLLTTINWSYNLSTTGPDDTKALYLGCLENNPRLRTTAAYLQSQWGGVVPLDAETIAQRNAQQDRFKRLGLCERMIVADWLMMYQPGGQLGVPVVEKELYSSLYGETYRFLSVDTEVEAEPAATVE